MEYFWTVIVSFAVGCAVPIWIRRQSRRNEPFKLMGTEIPQLSANLDLQKRYDLSFDKDDKLEQHREIKILGSVDRDSDSVFGASGRWLVVEFPNGKRAYVPTYSIRAIQESEVA